MFLAQDKRYAPQFKGHRQAGQAVSNSCQPVKSVADRCSGQHVTITPATRSHPVASIYTASSVE